MKEKAEEKLESLIIYSLKLCHKFLKCRKEMGIQMLEANECDKISHDRDSRYQNKLKN